MRGIGTWIILLLVAFLVGVSYPPPLLKDLLRYSVASVSVGATPAPLRPSPSPTAAPTVVPSPTVAPTPVPPPSATPTRPPEAGRPLPTKPVGRSEVAPLNYRDVAVELPRSIRIPAIGVDAGFEFVGLTAEGAMDVPKDGANVAWYQLGPRPGERGNAIVAGHVDWGGKTAVFWKLNELKAGSMVEIVATDDRRYEFVVQWQRWYDAEGAPVEEVFGQSEAVEVTLVTCGGAFDPKTRQYRSRLVVRGILR